MLPTISTSNSPALSFNQFSACDVKRSAISITSGTVNTSRNMVLPILDKILLVIFHILNYSVSNSVFPPAWKMAQIIKSIPLPNLRLDFVD